MGIDDAGPLRDVLGIDEGPPPGPEELRGIVARARRHHRRTAAIGVVVALAAGGAGGYLVAGNSGGSTKVAASQPAGSDPGPAYASAPSGAIVSGGGNAVDGSGLKGQAAFTALFNRTAGGVSIRGFLTNFPQPTPAKSGPAADCMVFGPPEFQAELSTAKMVGQTASIQAADRTKPLSAVGTTVQGEAEGDPLISVVAATGPTVASVQITFAGGAADHMTPVQGWVTLASTIAAAPTSSTASLGTLSALDGAGRVLATQSITLADQGLPMSKGCIANCLNIPTGVQPKAGVPGAMSNTNAGAVSGTASGAVSGSAGPMITATGSGSSSSVGCAVAEPAIAPTPAVSTPGAPATSVPGQ